MINSIMASSTVRAATLGLVDNGSNLCLMGPEFHVTRIEKQRKRSLYGFEGPTKMVTYNVGIGLTLVEDSLGEQFLIRIHEGVITTQKLVLSANQKSDQIRWIFSH